MASRGPISSAGAPPIGHALSPRIQALAARVQNAKQQQQTVFELFIVWFFGVLVYLPSLFLGGFIVNPVNHVTAIFRFGKVDRIITKPGLAWLPAFYERITTFTGTQTHKMAELQGESRAELSM